MVGRYRMSPFKARDSVDRVVIILLDDWLEHLPSEARGRNIFSCDQVARSDPRFHQ